MKQLAGLLAALVALVCVLFGLKSVIAQSSPSAGQDKVIIYNWGDYIDPELIKEFEAEYGYQVVYETFDSNEAMITKIKQGGTNYDIAIPSEYKISEMIDSDLLVPLDYSKIEGFDHIDDRFKNLSFDPGNTYSIPYFWGTLGIIYNDKMVDGGKLTKWDDLWRPEYKDSILLIDGARETLGIGLQRNHYSLNETKSSVLSQVTGQLEQLMPNVKAVIADEIKMYMVQEEAAIAVTFSGEAAEMMDQNEHLHYVIPEEGSNLWFDNMVIPKTAKNVDGAYDFMSFMLRPDVATRNAEYVGYATPNADAKKLLPEEITSQTEFYPDDELLKRLEVYDNIGVDKTGEYNDLFLEIKMY